ncbi:MAG: potassium transporter TrkG [Bacteroidales bacterium]|nr:potassium transporter TrkG [Bacteroidales bacterium]
MTEKFKNKLSIKYVYKTAFVISLLGVIFVIVDFGFDQSNLGQRLINNFLFLVLATGLLSLVISFIYKTSKVKIKVLVFDVASAVFIGLVVIAHFVSPEKSNYLSNLQNDIWIRLAVLLIFIREFSDLSIGYKRASMNPAQLFISSFLGIIFVGTILLSLPKATYSGITFIDALFTSTSAVCVTGLIVVDTGTYFTLFGQIIILVLIQLGGIGILTFASYFSYFFKGVSSYENHLVLGDMTNLKKLGDVFVTLKRIVLTTFGIELVGAAFLFASIDKNLIVSVFDRGFFSVFHAVSAFCNAGFSTLQNSLFEQTFRFNYSLQMVVIILVILGGLGFPIVFNLLKYLKYFIVNRLFKPAVGERKNIPWVLNINSRITLTTTLALTIIGTLFFYFGEYHNTLEEHHGIGKVITAFFSAATPRTAGFNNVDIGALHFPTLIMIIFLMWVGASPGSTGGGIKTSTFAIAILNILSLAKGKSRIEVYRREIADISAKRASATILLSFIVIGFGIMGITYFDSQKSLLPIAFECFSAFGTVGLSMGITASLSSAGKVIIVLIMFIGRVTMLSILIAVFKKVKHKNYHYPSEEITIN